MATAPPRRRAGGTVGTVVGPNVQVSPTGPPDPVPVLEGTDIKPGAKVDPATVPGTGPVAGATPPPADPWIALEKWFLNQFPGYSNLASGSAEMRRAIGGWLGLTSFEKVMEAAGGLAGWDGSTVGQMTPQEFLQWQQNQSGGWATAGWTPEQINAWVGNIGAGQTPQVQRMQQLRMAQTAGWAPSLPPDVPFDETTWAEFVAAHPELDPAILKGLKFFLGISTDPSGIGTNSGNPPHIGQMLDALGIPRDAVPPGARQSLAYGKGKEFLQWALTHGYDPVEAVKAFLTNPNYAGMGVPKFTNPGVGMDTAPAGFREWEQSLASPNANPAVLQAYNDWRSGAISREDYLYVAQQWGANPSDPGQTPEDWAAQRAEFSAKRKAMEEANGGQNVYRYASVVTQYATNMNVYVPPGFEFVPGIYEVPPGSWSPPPEAPPQPGSWGPPGQTGAESEGDEY